MKEGSVLWNEGHLANRKGGGRKNRKVESVRQGERKRSASRPKSARWETAKEERERPKELENGRRGSTASGKRKKKEYGKGKSVPRKVKKTKDSVKDQRDKNSSKILLLVGLHRENPI